jgi:hypothetical protein
MPIHRTRLAVAIAHALMGYLPGIQAPASLATGDWA